MHFDPSFCARGVGWQVGGLVLCNGKAWPVECVHSSLTRYFSGRREEGGGYWGYAPAALSGFDDVCEAFGDVAKLMICPSIPIRLNALCAALPHLLTPCPLPPAPPPPTHTHRCRVRLLLCRVLTMCVRRLETLQSWTIWWPGVQDQQQQHCSHHPEHQWHSTYL